MPESKPPRKKNVEAPAVAAKKPAGNPRWLVPTMLGLMILGLLWIVTTYVTAPSGQTFPIPSLGQWNLAVGFVLLFAGFGLTTRWR